METITPKTGFSIKTDSYEGPFEVLLDLIEARKMLVNELALATITEEFIAHVRAKEAFPLEQTSNFIHIAATLILIKSKSLIPDLSLSEDESADVEDLQMRLMAYEKVREAARELARIFDRAPLMPAGERAREAVFAPSRDLSKNALAEALARVLAAREAVKELPKARVKPLVSIEEMMDSLAKRVTEALQTSFRELTANAKEKTEIIVSFLALLELVKQGVVAAEQSGTHTDITVRRPEGTAPHYG